MATVNRKNYRPIGKFVLHNNALYGSYNYTLDLELAISRAKYEGYTLPDTNTLIALDQWIKGKKANGTWYNKDLVLNMAYNNIACADFSLINLKNPWSITNLVTQSRNWADASWSGDTKVPNHPGTLAPDGTQTACYITNVGRTTLTRKTGITANSTTITYSIYAKSGSSTNSAFLLRNETTGTNFTTGSLTYSTGIITGAGWSVQNVGNGWFRVQYTQTTGITIGDNLSIYYGALSSTGGASSADWYVWGAQVEDRDKASRYNPTGASVIYGNGISTKRGTPIYTLNGYQGNNTDALIYTHSNPFQTGSNYTLNNASRTFILTVDGTSSSRREGVIASNRNCSQRSSLTTAVRINQTLTDFTGGVNTGSNGYKAIIRYDSSNVSVINKNVEDLRTVASTAMQPESQVFLGFGGVYGNDTFGNYELGAAITYIQSQNDRTLYNTYLTKIGLTAIA